MFIVKEKISKEELKKSAKQTFGDFVKAVVDVQKKIMAIGGDLHADEEALLIENSSRQEDLWGVNIYPDKYPQDWIEFDSMINIRPAQDNRSREIQNPGLKKQITDIIQSLVE